MDARPLGSDKAKVFPGSLRAQPERKWSDLCATWIDVHAIQILLNDQPGCRAAQVDEVRVVSTQRPARDLTRGSNCLDRPRFFVNCQQQVEGVEKEVPGAARRVENA